MSEENEKGAGAIRGFLDRLKAEGEGAFQELTAQLMENPLFLKALRASLEAKSKVDRTVSGAMDLMNLPSKNDVEKLLQEMERLGTRIGKQQRAVRELERELREIREQIGKEKAE